LLEIEAGGMYHGPVLSGSAAANKLIIPLFPAAPADGGRVDRVRERTFPLQLAFGISIHKSQGMTMEKAVIHLGQTEFTAALTFVALSRVRSWPGVFVHHESNLTWERYKHLRCKCGEEDARLEGMSGRTMQRLPDRCQNLNLDDAGPTYDRSRALRSRSRATTNVVDAAISSPQGPANEDEQLEQRNQYGEDADDFARQLDAYDVEMEDINAHQ